MYSLILSAESDALIAAMSRLSVSLSPSEALLDVAPLVRLCLSRLLAGQRDPSLVVSPLIDVISTFVPSPSAAAPRKCLALLAGMAFSCARSPLTSFPLKATRPPLLI